MRNWALMDMVHDGWGIVRCIGCLAKVVQRESHGNRWLWLILAVFREADTLLGNKMSDELIKCSALRLWRADASYM